MNKTRGKFRLVSLLPFFILIFTWSFLGGWITLFARIWLWLILGCFLVICISSDYFSSKQFFLWVFYTVVVLLNYLSGNLYFRSIINVLVEFGVLFFCGGVCYFLIKNNEENLKKVIVVLELFVIIFTSIATFLADKQIPDIVRLLVVYANQGVSISPYYRMGVCEYTMPHAIPILIAPLILWIKRKDFKMGIKLLASVVLLSLLLLVFTSGTTTPLLIAVFSLIASLLVSPNKTLKNNLIRLMIITLLVIPVFNDDNQLKIIHSLERIIPETNSNHGKLRVFESSIKYDETTGDIAARENLYKKSILSFSNNILLGTNANTLGNHSVVLDRLGALGLVGFIPYILFIWYTGKFIYYHIHERHRIYYIIGMLCFLMTIVLKNIGGLWMWIAAFIILPLMLNSDNNII